MEIKVTDSNFSSVVQSEVPVMVDFWATWCGPCRRLGPIVEEVAAEMAGKAVVAKCDVEEAPSAAEKMGIMSVPTVVFFKNGEEVFRQTGVASKALYIDKLNSLI